MGSAFEVKSRPFAIREFNRDTILAPPSALVPQDVIVSV